MQSLKQLIVVLVLAGISFALAKQFALCYMTERDFLRRRNLWIFITCVAFLSPSFWIFCAVVFPVILWFVQEEQNPVGLYVFLHYAIPSFGLLIPSIGFNNLFEFSYHRLLAFSILIPALIRYYSDQGQESPRLRLIDLAVVAYVLLQIFVLVPYEAITHTLRRTLILTLDILLLHFVVSRTNGGKTSIAEILSLIVLSGLTMAPLGVFENNRNWLLYESIAQTWGSSNPFAWLLRGDSLRAQVSAGHSLTFGFYMALAFCTSIGLLLLKTGGGRFRWLIPVVLFAGLFSSLSRGPIFAALLMVICYLILTASNFRTLVRGFALLFGIGVVVLLSPFGDSLIEYIPFMGTAEQFNVDYRQRLFETAMVLIPRNLFFGDPFILTHMEHLRQGQGIIDIVNGYLLITLYYGIVGLSLFVTYLVFPVYMTGRLWLTMRRADRDIYRLSALLISLMVGTLFFIATAGVDLIHYCLAALMYAFATKKLGDRVKNVMPVQRMGEPVARKP